MWYSPMNPAVVLDSPETSQRDESSAPARAAYSHPPQDRFYGYHQSGLPSSSAYTGSEAPSAIICSGTSKEHPQDPQSFDPPAAEQLLGSISFASVQDLHPHFLVFPQAVYTSQVPQSSSHFMTPHNEPIDYSSYGTYRTPDSFSNTAQEEPVQNEDAVDCLPDSNSYAPSAMICSGTSKEHPQDSQSFDPPAAEQLLGSISFASVQDLHPHFLVFPQAVYTSHAPLSSSHFMTPHNEQPIDYSSYGTYRTPDSFSNTAQEEPVQNENAVDCLPDSNSYTLGYTEQGRGYPSS